MNHSLKSYEIGRDMLQIVTERIIITVGCITGRITRGLLCLVCLMVENVII